MRREVAAKLEFAEGPRAAAPAFAQFRAAYGDFSDALARAGLAVNRLNLSILSESPAEVVSLKRSEILRELITELDAQKQALETMSAAEKE